MDSKMKGQSGTMKDHAKQAAMDASKHHMTPEKMAEHQAQKDAKHPGPMCLPGKGC